jgi:hypothetical protein
MVFFQTGMIPDLTAGESAGETATWRKIAANVMRELRTLSMLK